MGTIANDRGAARVRHAFLCLPVALFLAPAVGCFAQSNTATEPAPVTYQPTPKTSASTQIQSSGAPSARPAENWTASPATSPPRELAQAPSNRNNDNPGPATAVGGLTTQRRPTGIDSRTAIPPPRSWQGPAPKPDRALVPADRLASGRERTPTALDRHVDRQVVRAAGGPAPGPKAVARVIGVASPGLRIALDATESGKDVNFRWIQMRGPKVSATALDQPVLKFTVPGDAKELAFMLVAYSSSGVDSAVIDIPLLLRPKVALPLQVFADAGDDQIGLVGHEITLNGARSSPRDSAAFRWVQAEGPRVASISQDGWICSFIPTLPGVYRFVLVVAADGTISEPDDVLITVTSDLQPGLDRSQTAGSPAIVPPAVDVVARQALCALPGGAAAGAQLAEAFEGVAQRMDLYDSYADVQHEMSLRLNSVVPTDPTLRNLWNERLFHVLSSRIADAMRRDGLDLATNGAYAARMTEPQRNQLREVFTTVAQGFRKASGASASVSRDPTRSTVVADQADRSGALKVTR
jgi:hypothetical protein